MLRSVQTFVNAVDTVLVFGPFRRGTVLQSVVVASDPSALVQVDIRVGVFGDSDSAALFAGPDSEATPGAAVLVGINGTSYYPVYHRFDGLDRDRFVGVSVANANASGSIWLDIHEPTRGQRAT